MAALAIFKELGDKQMEASSLTTIANIRLSLPGSQINSTSFNII